MGDNAKIVSSRLNAKIRCTAVTGHFATNHSHINYYVDLTDVKTQQKMAQLAAIELARTYQTIRIDTIICLEGTEMIGAFLASALTQPSQVGVNAEADICVLAPELNANNQMLFRENTQKMVTEKSVLLLVSTASTGKTIIRALDCLRYYSSQLIGISALFSAVRDMHGVAITSVFDERDLPDYQTYIPGKCAMCEQKLKIDAIANSFGYSRL